MYIMQSKQQIMSIHCHVPVHVCVAARVRLRKKLEVVGD